MKGYEDEEKIAECQNCGNLLVNEKVVEEEFDNQTYISVHLNALQNSKQNEQRKKN